MEKLIFRQFFYELFFTFIILTVCLSIIVWVIQAVNFLDLISEDGHGLNVYFAYSAFNFPKIFTKIYIFSLFVTFYYVITKYDNKNELSIFWSIGISKKEFVNKVLKYSLLFLFFHLLFTLYISPATQNLSRSYIRSSTIDFFPSLIKEKTFVDTVKNLTIYVEKQSNDKKQFNNVYIKDQSINNDEFQIIIASKGEIINKNKNNYLLLYNGEIFSNNSKDLTSFKFENFEFNLSQFKTKTTTIPKIQENKTSNIIKCYLKLKHKKNFYINEKELACYADSFYDIVNEILRRFTISLYVPLLSFIASMLIMNNKINKFYYSYKVIIFILGFCTIFFSEVIINYSSKNEVINSIFFILPIISFVIFYSIFLIKDKNLN